MADRVVIIDIFVEPGQMGQGILTSASTNVYERVTQDQTTYRTFSAFVDDGDIAGLNTAISGALAGTVFP